MNNKQLYKKLMISISKEVKNALNESRVKKYEFSKKDLKEIREIILEDVDFYKAYCQYANLDRYDSYEDAVDDVMNFLEYDVYTGEVEDDFVVHKWYMLDEPDLGCSWVRLKSGKIANLDNLYKEFKGIIKE